MNRSGHSEERPKVEPLFAMTTFSQVIIKELLTFLSIANYYLLVKSFSQYNTSVNLDVPK